ncbi:hypothetical protein KKH24_00950, partial [Patescibacteria group bacterium]|nr:hypothetical protein [Patescibacteria group bacterium]
MMGEGKSEAQFMPTTVEVPKSEKELVEGAVDGLEKVVSVLREAIAQGKTEGVEAGLARIFGPEGMNA